MNYITVDYLKQRNPTIDTSLYSDTTLSGMIGSASAWVDSFLGYTLQIEVISAEKADGIVDSDGNLVIYPRKRPIVSISSITLVKGVDAISLDLTDGTNNKYDIPTTADRILYPNRSLAFNSVTFIRSLYQLRESNFFSKLDYIAGYQSEIPLDIQEAVMLMTRDQIARSMNITGAESISQGGISISYGGNSQGRSDNQRDAETILHTYKRLTP